MKTQAKSGSLAALKRRIQVGTRLKCIENTYRPALNGTTREVVRVLTVAFTWKQDGDASPQPSWTHYPKADGLTWIDDDTFQLKLFDAHYVRLQFIDPPHFAFACKVCGADLGWDRPSGVCSEACLKRGQKFA